MSYSETAQHRTWHLLLFSFMTTRAVLASKGLQSPGGAPAPPRPAPLCSHYTAASNVPKAIKLNSPQCEVAPQLCKHASQEISGATLPCQSNGMYTLQLSWLI